MCMYASDGLTLKITGFSKRLNRLGIATNNEVSL